VARIYGIARTTLARHRAHVVPTSTPLAAIRTEDGPDGPADPLAEAFLLAEKARTPRERLRALEQVRSATRLRLRGVADLDREDRELLDSNIRHAETAYRDAGDFETAARGLSGWREAILQRLDAADAPGMIEIPMKLALADGTPLPGESIWPMKPEQYWSGVPKRYRDLERFMVQRVLHLRWADVPDRPDRPRGADEDLKVYNRESGALVWAR
jgi:hypothetical protein